MAVTVIWELPIARKTSPAPQAVLQALGNPVRREIISLLRPGPRPVGELASRLPVSRPAVSKHLSVLQKAELVAFDKSDARNLYHLDKRGFDSVRRWLDEFWDVALERFVIAAEKTHRKKQ